MFISVQFAGDQNLRVKIKPILKAINSQDQVGTAWDRDDLVDRERL